MGWVGGYERGSIIFGPSTQICFWLKQVKETKNIRVKTRMLKLQIVCGAQISWRFCGQVNSLLSVLIRSNGRREAAKVSKKKWVRHVLPGFIIRPTRASKVDQQYRGSSSSSSSSSKQEQQQQQFNSSDNSSCGNKNTRSSNSITIVIGSDRCKSN